MYVTLSTLNIDLFFSIRGSHPVTRSRVDATEGRRPGRLTRQNAAAVSPASSLSGEQNGLCDGRRSHCKCSDMKGVCVCVGGVVG